MQDPQPKASLEHIVTELARELVSFSNQNRAGVDKLIAALDSQIPAREKQNYKNLLLEKLNLKYDVNYRISASFSTICSAYIFFLNLGLSHKDILAVVKKFPSVLALDPQNYMQRRVDYLIGLGLAEKDIPTVVKKFPQVLALDPKECMHPKYHFIAKEMGFEFNLLRFPRCFSYSLRDRYIPRFLYLKRKNGEGRYTLESIIFPSDRNFAERANSSLADYSEFKKELVKHFTPGKTKASRQYEEYLNGKARGLF